MKRAWTLILMILVFGSGVVSTTQAKPSVPGRAAVSAARHDWKEHVVHTFSSKIRATSTVGPVPRNFGSLPPQQRLAYLHARRNLDVARFDRFHPYLGPYLARDDRLRAAQGASGHPVNGLFPDTPLSRYLQYRRSLNPTRFDIYHPALGALLDEDQRLRAGTPSTGPETIMPPVVVIPPPPSTPTSGIPGSGPPNGGNVPPTNSVPEPGSITLILIGAAAAGPRLWRRMKRTTPSE